MEPGPRMGTALCATPSTPGRHLLASSTLPFAPRTPSWEGERCSRTQSKGGQGGGGRASC